MINFRWDTGQTLYFTVRDLNSGEYWSTSLNGMEPEVVSHWNNYTMPMIENPTNGYLYVANFPSAPAGYYYVDVFLGNTINTLLLAVEHGYWDGTHFNPQVQDLSILSTIQYEIAGGNNIISSSPVSKGQVLTLIQGDNYDTSTNQPLAFTDGGMWPNLTNSDIHFTIAQNDQIETTLVSSVCTLNIGPPQVVMATLGSAQTNMLTPGLSYAYDVRARMTSGELRTLVYGGSVIVNTPITIFTSTLVATIQITGKSGSIITFNCTPIGGQSPYSYQWYVSSINGQLGTAITSHNPIGFGTTQSLRIPQLPDTTKYYTCIVVDSADNTVESNQLQVFTPPILVV
jgi:hypothetical protein